MIMTSMSLQELKGRYTGRRRPRSTGGFGDFTVISARKKSLENPIDWQRPTMGHPALMERVLLISKPKALKDFWKR